MIYSDIIIPIRFVFLKLVTCLLFLISLFFFTSCKKSGESIPILKPKIVDGFNVVGHRGFSSVYPQNTITSFIKAIDLGLNIVELDVCISQDSQVVVSHEHYMSSDYVNKPNGMPVLKSEEKELVLFEMPYAEIQKYDVGLRATEHKMTRKFYSDKKPRLSDLLNECESYAQRNGRKPITYIVEIKSLRGPLGKWQPASMSEYCKLVNAVLARVPSSRIIINSFDPGILNTWKKGRNNGTLANVPLGLYVYETNILAEEKIKNLGFIPEMYSPIFSSGTIEEDLVFCKTHGIKYLPWTVNDLKSMVKLKEIGVDGIMTDFPNLYIDNIGK